MLLIISDRVSITYANGGGGEGGRGKNPRERWMGEERHIYGAGFLLTLEPRGASKKMESEESPFFPHGEFRFVECLTSPTRVISSLSSVRSQVRISS